jgi:DNA sulfur modification protein DndE
MSFQRIRISEDATFKLRILKGRTGLTPNILCRIAFCLSLGEPKMPNLNNDSGGQEFNRYTLTGEWDSLFIALLKEKLIREGQDSHQDLILQFKEHLERGIILLYNRVKNISDFVDLLPSIYKTSS